MFAELDYREEEMAGVVEYGETVFSGDTNDDDPELNEDLEELLTKNARARTIDSLDDELLSHEELCDVGVHSRELPSSKCFLFSS